MVDTLPLSNKLFFLCKFGVFTLKPLSSRVINFQQLEELKNNQGSKNFPLALFNRSLKFISEQECILF